MENKQNQKLEEKVNSFSEKKAALDHSKKEWGFLTGISAYLTLTGAPLTGLALWANNYDKVSALGALALVAAPVAIAAGVTYLAKCKAERLEQEVIDLYNNQIGGHYGK